MTNIPHFNFPAFDDASAAARELDFDISNPHEHDQATYPGIDEAQATVNGNVLDLREEVGFDYAAAMRWDLSEVIRCDAIILLPGWEGSTGARCERFVAEMTGKTVFLAVPDGDRWGFEPDPVQKRLTTQVVVMA